MMIAGWVLFGVTLLVATALGITLKSRNAEELTRLRGQQKLELTETRTDARARVDRLEREAVRGKTALRDDLALDILPALDGLRLARDGFGDAEVRRGVDLVIREFERGLARHGIEAVEPQPGAPFDPALHEAVETMDDPEQVPGNIGRCHRVGYRADGRTLRPALVGVVQTVSAAAEGTESAVRAVVEQGQD